MFLSRDLSFVSFSLSFDIKLQILNLFSRLNLLKLHNSLKLYKIAKFERIAKIETSLPFSLQTDSFDQRSSHTSETHFLRDILSLSAILLQLFFL